MSVFSKETRDGEDVIVERRTIETSAWSRAMLESAIQDLQQQLWQLAIRKAALEAELSKLPEAKG